MSRQQIRWLIAWSAIAISLGIWLIVVDKPWGPIADEIADREEAGHLLKTRHFTGQTLWWTALLLWIATVIAAVSFRFWTTPLAPTKQGLQKSQSHGKFIWFGLILIMGIGFATRLPLASKSLWWDEMWNAKSTIVGYYLGDPDDPIEERRFGEASMERAMWLYSKPTSHAVASVPARLSHLALSDAIDPDRQPYEFRDWVVRLPSLIASVISIGLIGALGFRFGNARVGFVAAFLLAIHPWHVRLGIEIRAYTWVFLWTLIGLVILALLFRKGKPARWRYWIAFGIVQALFVWSFPYAAFLAGGFFIAAAALIFHTWPDRANRIIAIRRLIFVNVFAALLFIHFFGPNLLQMLGWYDTVTGNHEDHSLTLHWLGQTFQLSSLGYIHENGWVATAICIFVIGSAAWGGFILWSKKEHRTAFWILSSVVIGLILALIFFKITGTYYYPRFLFYGVIPLFLLMAIGWGKSKHARIRCMVGVLLLASVFQPRIAELRSRPIEPLRNVAAFLESRDGHIIPIGFGHSTEYLNVYLPAARMPIMDNFRSNLVSVIEEAREKKRPLFVILGRPAFNRSTINEGFDLLDDSSKFQKCAEFPATENGFNYEIYQLNEQ